MNLFLVCKSERVLDFFPLFQKGVKVASPVGQSIKKVLCEEWGINPEYLDQRIKTIFLDGKAVDDLDKAVLWDGSTLALSAAMPGLAGAILRRGGMLAPLRSQIALRDDKEGRQQKEGMIVLKLFNLLGGELAPGLLKRGVYIEADEFLSFLKNLSAEFWLGCRRARLNGQEIDVKSLREGQGLDANRLIYLLVDFGDEKRMNGG